MNSPQTDTSPDTPRGNRSGFLTYARQDILSGFLVFLIALPLCLGISLASGYPPLAGIFTAIIGAVVATFLSNSELTIKGPAAGLIVIAVGCIQDFGGDGAIGGFSAVDHKAYQAALAVGVAAAVLQICFGLFRAGILGEFFPSAAVHGMLAAIGVIIIAKQFPVVLGVSASGEPLELLWEIPHFLWEANPAIATIGAVSLLIMFLWPLAGKRSRLLKAIPAPLVVLLVAVPMGTAFDLLHEHSYMLRGHKYQLGEQFLVSMPDRVFGMFQYITFPDFAVLGEPRAWKWVFMFFAIGSIESMLSAKAVDLLDPWKRKTDLNRDVVAVGVGNLGSALIGGLPMISEIVRSRANIDNGACTRFANFWHGVFLLACVALIPMVLHLIPLAALAAMLVYTGYRLAHPKEFMHIYSIGREQFIVFVATLVAVLATDLLIGIALGILLKLVIHLINGVPLKSLFKPYFDVEQKSEKECLVRAYESAIFSNWIPFRRELENLGLVQGQNITLDLSDARLVDHSVMEKLQEMQRDFDQAGLRFELTGLDNLAPLSRHELSARRGNLTRMRRLTLIVDETLEVNLEQIFIDQGATGYTVFPCRGLGRKSLLNGVAPTEHKEQLWFELIVTEEVCDRLLNYLRQELLPTERLIITVSHVEVIRREHFQPLPQESCTLEMISH